MTKLYLTPQNANYAATSSPNEVHRDALDGGQGRYQADEEGSASIVDVSWLTDQDGYEYLSAFSRSVALNGKTAFTIDLLLEGYPLAEYSAHFIPGSLKLVGYNGLGREVSAQLEVAAPTEDADFDSSIVDVWEGSDGDPQTYINLFAPIIAAWPRI